MGGLNNEKRTHRDVFSRPRAIFEKNSPNNGRLDRRAASGIPALDLRLSKPRMTASFQSRLVVSDPEPEQRNEDLSIETAGEGKRHECPRVDERIVAQVINLARLSMFRGPVCQAGKRWRLRKLCNK